MGYLNHQSNLLRRFAVLCVAASVSQAAIGSAATRTFQFSTTVASLSELPSPATPPFAVAEGDILIGTFTFDAAVGAGGYPQSGNLVFQLAGQHLLISGFQINVVNNGAGVIDTVGRIADPARTPDVDRAAFQSDRIEIACPGGVADFCGVVEGLDGPHFSARLVFEDENLARIGSTDLPGDETLWSSFEKRELIVLFENGFRIGAFIGPLHQVPEPSGASTAACMAAGACGFLRNRRIRSERSTIRIDAPPLAQVRLAQSNQNRRR